MPNLASLANISVAFLLVTMLVGSPLDVTANSTSQTVTVDSPTLNLRSGPGLSFSKIGKLKNQEKVQVLERSGDWIKVTHNGQNGWIASWLTKETVVNGKSGQTIVARVDSLNIRSAPSIASAVIGKLMSGDTAKLIEYRGEWASIEIDGTRGWVHTTYISEVPSDSSSSKQTPEKQHSTQADMFTVSVTKLNVRNKATQTSRRIASITKNETFTIEKIEGNWVKIKLSNKQSGWVYSFHGTLTNKSDQTTAKRSSKVTIATNGTNIRLAASTASEVVLRADAGDEFMVTEKKGDWFEIVLPNGKTAYVAEWVVQPASNSSSTPQKLQKKEKRVKGTLKGLTIALDPGHGGNDRGTTGTRGADEKDLTLMTAELLSGKLKNAGAKVILTRNSDEYVSLRKRTDTAHHASADAFISLHYDSNPDRSISGFTSFYMQQSQHSFASAIHNGLKGSLSLTDRGTQPANFQVLRENQLPAVLIELGFLSNSSEERVITSSYFREQASQGIYKGLLNYFDAR